MTIPLNDKLKGLTFIDLFAGIGGFRLALEHFGAKCVFSSEWDKKAQITYQVNFGDIPTGDITKINESDVAKHDILCAGFPCQAFSVSGKQRGFHDARGTLFFDIARIAKHHRPSVLFLENVRNFQRHDNGNTLKTVASVLDELGYQLWHQVLNASHYGLAQKRERVYFICVRKDLDVKKFNFPDPTYEQVKLRDYLLPDAETSQYGINREDITLNVDKIPTETLHVDYPLKPVRVGTINKGGQGERIYSDLGHAITLSAYGGGVASKTGAYLINGKVRKLAPQECALIQGFPSNFKIPVSDCQAYKQFGNSVPVTVVKHIVNSLANLPPIIKLASSKQNKAS